MGTSKGFFESQGGWLGCGWTWRSIPFRSIPASMGVRLHPSGLPDRLGFEGASDFRAQGAPRGGCRFCGPSAVGAILCILPVPNPRRLRLVGSKAPTRCFRPSRPALPAWLRASQKSDPGPCRRKASVTALGTSRRGPFIPPSPDPRRSGGPWRRHIPCGCPRGRCRWRGWRLRWTVPGSFGPAPGRGR